MSSDSAQVLNKYNMSGSDTDKSASAVYHELSTMKPDWGKYGPTQKYADLLKLLQVGAPGMETMLCMKGNLAIVQACMDALTVDDEKAVQWIVTLLCDMLREDSMSYGVFEDASQSGVNIFQPFFNLVNKKTSGSDFYSADRAVWILSALMGHMQTGFEFGQVEALVVLMTNKSLPTCSELGRLEAITNLLKSDTYRASVWKMQLVTDSVFGVSTKASSQALYKCVFAMWLLAFDGDLVEELITHRAVSKIRGILASCRVEKVVRICLTVLKALLQHSNFGAEIVDANLFDSVQNLEFEKWRDAELYDDIRDVASQISSRVQELSNFARYEQELASGSLSWGFIHTSKFWAENVMKFDQNDFKTLKTLLRLLCDPNTDVTSLAVACHDVGEFVALHPLGKKKVAQLHIKDRIMELMGSTGDDKREVRREALLCCQKIMLNKWQDIEKTK
jgi:V-type H+-transporting ATPase subunit H|eukprot:TRINITY_DN54936_c0_g1_i1.p1 TRINITY_DN54936_c0_g1~~TRINITY_DN54936_c0_g1_i1.p1  ORF type:complete len:449 (+),score=79.41 TRINITY_DN54936_c0_g1_i1:68-1414(+)